MPKINADWDALYPYYFIGGEHYEIEIELSDEDIAFIHEAHHNFWIAQNILKKAVHPNGR